jgi:hypothetical protein
MSNKITQIIGNHEAIDYYLAGKAGSIAGKSLTSDDPDRILYISFNPSKMFKLTTMIPDISLLIRSKMLYVSAYEAPEQQDSFDTGILFDIICGIIDNKSQPFHRTIILDNVIEVLQYYDDREPIEIVQQLTDCIGTNRNITFTTRPRGESINTIEIIEH